MELAKDGGRIGVVMVETFMHAPNSKYIRDFLKPHNITHICDLPHNTFKPHCNAKTVFLIFEKNVVQQKKISLLFAEHMGHDHRGETTYRWNETTNTLDQETIWDDIADLKQEILDKADSAKILDLKHKTIARNDVYVPRFYFNRLNANKNFDAFCEENDATPKLLSELVEEKHITTFNGHGSPNSATKGKGELPYVRVKDIVNWRTYVDPTATVPDELFDEFVTPTKRLKPRDILFVRRGSNRIGSVAMILPRDIRCILTSEILVIRVIEPNELNLDPFYLLFALSMDVVLQQTRASMLFDTTLPNLGDRWQSLKIPIFPLGTREEISRKMQRYYEHQNNADNQIKELSERYGKLVT